jgi:uncharacterized RDD family membrane protein YckC
VVSPASLARRVNATTIDLLVWVALGWGAPHALPDGVPGVRALRAALFWGTPFFLEPILLRFAGQTIGQACLGLRVVAVDGRALGFVRLTLRYWTKLALGSLSLFYILFTHRRQALHDRAFGTAVLRVPRGAELGGGESAVALERAPDPRLPSARRRFAVFLVWAALAELVLLIVVAAGLDLLGWDPDAPPAKGGGVELVANLASLAVVLAVAHLGAAGRLPGARRSGIADAG